MTGLRDTLAGFDLAEALGVGLDNRQLGHLAAALFLAIFGLLALRRVGRTSGPVPALWIAISAGLIAGAAAIVGRGFPNDVPDELRPWTEPDRVVRAAAVVTLLGTALVFGSAYWLRGRWSRLACRTAGIAAAGLAVWLAAGWFGDQLPDDARLFAGRTTVARGLAVGGLVLLAGFFWVRQAGEKPAGLWAKRSLAAPALAIAAVLGVRWFGPVIDADIPVADVTRIAALAAAVAAGTCLIIAAGARLLRPNRRRLEKVITRRTDSLPPLPLAGEQPLPVAVLLDDAGRPILPTNQPPGR